MECEELLNDLINSVSYMQRDDIEIVRKAFFYAENAHRGQFRNSGEPYISHPVSVAMILAQYKCDEQTIVAALLHDVVEDTVYLTSDISESFGTKIAQIVDGLTKNKWKADFEKIYYEAKNIRKLLIAAIDDIRVVIIKLADKLHNMRTLAHKETSNQLLTAKQTLNFFVPVAKELEITPFYQELEDLSFLFLEPSERKKIIAKKQADNSVDTITLEKVSSEIKKHFELENKIFELALSKKSNYEHYLNEKSLDTQVAITISVDSTATCYLILGLLHQVWNHVVKSFEDHMSNKSNSFSKFLKTAVIIADVQVLFIIQTQSQKNIGNLGALNLIKYSKNTSAGGHNKFLFFNGAIEKLNRLSGHNDLKFFNQISNDYLQGKITVYNTDLTAVSLPKNSSVIDFAYATIPLYASQIIYALINDKKENIFSKINDGDVIKLITSKKSLGVNQNWLAVCATSIAKHEINCDLENSEKKWLRLQTPCLSDNQVEVRFAKCCYPLPIDDIVLASCTERLQKTVHKKNCKMIKKDSNFEITPVAWSKINAKYYEFSIDVIGQKNTFNDLEFLKKIQELKLNILEYSTKKLKINIMVTIRVKLYSKEAVGEFFSTITKGIIGVQYVTKHKNNNFKY